MVGEVIIDGKMEVALFAFHDVWGKLPITGMDCTEQFDNPIDYFFVNPEDVIFKAKTP